MIIYEDRLVVIPTLSPTVAAPDIHSWFLDNVAHLTGSPITPATTPAEIRAKILRVEELLTESVQTGETVDTNPMMKLNHVFAEGVYLREMLITAGNLIIGKIHRHCLVNFISYGRVSVITEFEGVRVYEGPCTFTSPAGTKRLLFTHTDTLWSGVHPTNETDLAKIEEQFIAKNYEELKCLP